MIPEDARAAIREKMKTLDVVAFALILVGLPLQVASGQVYAEFAAAPRTPEELSSAMLSIRVMSALGMVMLIAGLGIYARAKGQRGAWGLLGVLSGLGLLILYFIDKRCHHCGSASSFRTKECGACRGPM